MLTALKESAQEAALGELRRFVVDVLEESEVGEDRRELRLRFRERRREVCAQLLHLCVEAVARVQQTAQHRDDARRRILGSRCRRPAFSRIAFHC